MNSIVQIGWQDIVVPAGTLVVNVGRPVPGWPDVCAGQIDGAPAMVRATATGWRIATNGDIPVRPIWVDWAGPVIHIARDMTGYAVARA